MLLGLKQFTSLQPCCGASRHKNASPRLIYPFNNAYDDGKAFMRSGFYGWMGESASVLNERNTCLFLLPKTLFRTLRAKTPLLE